MTEKDPAGDTFLAQLCVQWEAATVVARRKGIAAEHMYADAFYTQGT